MSIDAPIPLERLTTNTPPPFASGPVHSALAQALSRPRRVQVPELHIEAIAQSYKRVFEEVLEGADPG